MPRQKMPEIGQFPAKWAFGGQKCQVGTLGWANFAGRQVDAFLRLTVFKAFQRGVEQRRNLKLFFAAVLTQQFRHFVVILYHRQVQRRISLIVLGIDVGPFGQQQFHHGFVG